MNVNFSDDAAQVLQNPYSIGSMKNPSKRMQFIAVNKKPEVGLYIEDMHVDVQLFLLRRDPANIRYIKKYNKELLKSLVSESERFLWCINSNDSLMMFAATLHPEHVIRRPDLSDNIKKVALKYKPELAFSLSLSSDMKAHAIKMYPSLASHMAPKNNPYVN